MIFELSVLRVVISKKANAGEFDLTFRRLCRNWEKLTGKEFKIGDLL